MIATPGAGNGETLPLTDSNGHDIGVIYYDPNGSSRTGVILPVGTENGQLLRVVNIADAAEAVTFATDATSNVAGGTAIVVGQNEHMQFLWSTALGRWLPHNILSAVDIPDGTITDAKVSASATIAFSKLAALNSARILVGNGSNVATSVAMSGDTTISNAGIVTIGAGKVTGAKTAIGLLYSTVCTNTNATTPVNVLGATTPTAITITGVRVTALDTTAGNIIIKNAGATVVSIAKGTSSGVVTGGTTLANTAVAGGATLTVESDSAGNARVEIIFTVA